MQKLILRFLSCVFGTLIVPSSVSFSVNASLGTNKSRSSLTTTQKALIVAGSGLGLFTVGGILGYVFSEKSNQSDEVFDISQLSSRECVLFNDLKASAHTDGLANNSVFRIALDIYSLETCETLYDVESIELAKTYPVIRSRDKSRSARYNEYIETLYLLWAYGKGQKLDTENRIDVAFGKVVKVLSEVLEAPIEDLKPEIKCQRKHFFECHSAPTSFLFQEAVDLDTVTWLFTADKLNFCSEEQKSQLSEILARDRVVISSDQGGKVLYGKGELRKIYEMGNKSEDVFDWLITPEFRALASGSVYTKCMNDTERNTHSA